MDKLKQIIAGSNASIFQRIDPDSNISVFTPAKEEEILSAIAYAKEKKLPITIKGGGSGLSGACTGSSRDKVIISTMRLKKVHELNFEKNYALVEPGITPDELNDLIKEKNPNWKFFVAPSSRDIATLGGILSTDGGGNDAWLAGTMIDNVLAVELFDYNGNKITIEQKENGDILNCNIISENKNLENELQKENFSLMDIAGSHGVLGFISKMKVKIKPLPKKEELYYTLVHAKNLRAFGQVIHELINSNIPLSYGESIVEAHHPEISGKTNPPMFILEFPKKYQTHISKTLKAIKNIDYSKVEEDTFEEMKDVRINMAKRNPPKGFQIALFEGYGIYGENLLQFDKIIDEINKTLKKHQFSPFIKFGHAPSLWHVGNKTIKGIIMHSREIRPEQLTGELAFEAIVDLVKTCERLGVTPKPEHKWPYSKTTEKHKRLVKLSKIIGEVFNPFVLNCTIEELANLVL